MREAARAAMAFDEEPEFRAYQVRLREAMTATAFETATAAGRTMPFKDAVALAVVD